MPVLADVKVLPEHLLETRDRPAPGPSRRERRERAPGGRPRRLPVVQAHAEHRTVVGDSGDEARELLGAHAVGDPARDVDRDVRVAGLRAQEAERARDVAVGGVEALERAARVHHRREGVRGRRQLCPREPRPRARPALGPRGLNGTIASGVSPAACRTRCASATARLERRSAFRSRVDSMLRATPSNGCPLAVRKLSIASERRTSSAGFTCPGRYHATTDPARVQPLDEASELCGRMTSAGARSFAVSIQAFTPRAAMRAAVRSGAANSGPS